jgi:hypothetical protein
MGPGNALPAHWLAAITQPTLVLTGGNSPAWMTNAGRAVAGTIQGAVHRVLEGQMHNVSRKRSLQSCSNSSLPEQRRNLLMDAGGPAEPRNVAVTSLRAAWITRSVWSTDRSATRTQDSGRAEPLCARIETKPWKNVS